MDMKKLARRLWQMSILAGAFALCGGTAMAQDKSDLQTILDAKEVKVGAVSAPPYYTKDLITNQWVGLVPDIMAKIFGPLGIKVDYVDTQWGTAVAGLQSNRFDLMGAYNETPERAKAVDFTKPIGALKMAVLVFGNDISKYATWDGMNVPSVRLSAVDGAGATRLLQPLIPKATWIVDPTSDAMYLELESGRADALVTSDVQITQYLQQRHKGTLIVPTPVYSQPTNIALRKNADPVLRAWLDQAIDKMQKDGSMDAIWAKYVQKSAAK
jgi:polar amino acid transport system substrate-binding protein